MKITRDEYAKSYVIEIEGECYYWNPPIESRLNQTDGAIEASPSQEPASLHSVAEYERLLRDAAAQIARYKASSDLYALSTDEALKKIAQLQADLDAAKAFNYELMAREEQLQAELETERMRLAACGTAALGYFEGCKDEYKSASLDDVLTLRAKCDQLQAENAELRQALVHYDFWTDVPQQAVNAIDAVLAEGRKG